MRRLNLDFVKSIGAFYSWNNKGDGDRIYSRIDHFICNDLWWNSFSDSVVQYLNASISDQCPLKLEIYQECKGGGRPFLIFNHLVKHSKFIEVVQEGWLSRGTRSMKGIWLALKKVKKRLKKLKVEEGGNVEYKVKY